MKVGWEFECAHWSEVWQRGKEVSAHLQLLGLLSFQGSEQPGLELWNGTAFACASG